MSTSYYLRSGTFIELENLTFKEKITVKTCPNIDCENHNKEMQDNFCPKCRSELVEKESFKEKDIFYYIQDELLKINQNADNIFYEINSPNILIIDGLSKREDDFFKFIENEDFDKLSDGNKLYYSVLKIIKNVDIHFKIIKGTFMGVN